MITELKIQYFKAFENVTARGLDRLNAFVGRNNAGKSSVLHALDMAGLALRWSDWNRFQLKLKVEDLFWDKGDFALEFTTDARQTVKISAANRRNPIIDLGGARKEDFDSILILPDSGLGLVNRRPVTPHEVFDYIQNRDYNSINALDILQAISFYAKGQERGFTQAEYDNLINQVRAFFPELESVVSDRTEDLHATLEYKENGRTLDILYSGMGLRRFLDVLIKVTLSKATLVLLDEPEFGMHPELQRRFLTFLQAFAAERNIQIFMATHSPVFINASAEFEVFRVSNEHGVRSITRVPAQLRYTMFGDLGIRPSDLFQNDICLMVEGPDDVVFYEYVLHELYREEFAGLAVGVVQYAGDAALGITSGDLRIANVAGAQPYLHWIRDRDAAIGAPPNKSAKAFVDALHEADQSASLSAKRELEFYIPEQVYVQAQNNDVEKEAAVRAIFAGDQSRKFREAMSASGCHVPRGSELRRLLRTNLTRNNLDHEISNMIEGILIPWARNLKGS